MTDSELLILADQVKNETTAEANTANRIGTLFSSIINNKFNSSSDWLNVTAFGLVGDGVTDNSTAFANLISSAPANARLFFPTGTYIINNGVTINKRIHLTGNGWGSIIQTPNNIHMITYDVGGGSQISDVIVCDIMFKGNNSTPSSGTGLRVTTGERFKIDNVRFDGFYNNLSFTNNVENVITRSYFVSMAHYGIEFTNSGIYTDAGDNCISDCHFIPATRDCTASIIQTNNGGMKIVNCKFNFQASGSFKAQYHYYYNGTGSTVDFNFSNNSVENYSIAGIRIGKGSGNFEQFSIVGNDFGTGTGTGIILDGVTDGFIVGNTMRAGGTNAISINNCDSIYIWNQYQGWSSNISQSGTNTNIFTALETPYPLTVSNDDIIQRKSGVWTNRTMAQLATDLGVTPSGGYKSVTGADTITTSDYYKTINCSGTSVDYTVGLPTAVGISGVWFRFVGASGLTKIVTIDANASETINGKTTRQFTADGGFTLVSDGSNWNVISEVSSWIPYTPSLYTGLNSGSFPATIQRYSLQGRTMIIQFDTGSAAAGGTTGLTFTMPTGYTCARQIRQTSVRVESNSTIAQGFAQVAVGNSTITFFSTVGGGTISGSGNKSVEGQIIIELQ